MLCGSAPAPDLPVFCLLNYVNTNPVKPDVPPFLLVGMGVFAPNSHVSRDFWGREVGPLLGMFVDWKRSNLIGWPWEPYLC